MQNPNRLLRWVAILSFASTLSCGKGSDASDDIKDPTDVTVDETETARDFEIRFAARVGALDVACDQDFTGLGPNNDQAVNFADFRFYVHGVELVKADGTSVPLVLNQESPWQTPQIALLDFENAEGECVNGTVETRHVIKGTAPKASYTAIRFVLGVPFELNHSDASNAQAPLDVTSLYWSWQGGYKFARLDAVTKQASGPQGFFSFHLGSTGCDGSPAGGVTTCAFPNRPTIELDNFDPDSSVIVADYGRLIEGMDLFRRTPTNGPGCMGSQTDPDCGDMFPRLGLPHSGRLPAQDFFSVEVKP